MLVRRFWNTRENNNHQENILFDDDMTESSALGYVSLEPGQNTQTGLHTDMEEICVVLKGRALLTVGNELQEVQAGDAAYIPRNTRHQLASISDENLEYLIFSNKSK